MPGKTIAECCFKAINRVTPLSAPNMILRVSKLCQVIRVQFEKEEQVEHIHSFAKSPGIDWDNAFNVKPNQPGPGPGIKLHHPIYGIVVHGVPTANLSESKMTDTNVLREFENENHLPMEAIIKVATLR